MTEKETARSAGRFFVPERIDAEKRDAAISVRPIASFSFKLPTTGNLHWKG